MSSPDAFDKATEKAMEKAMEKATWHYTWWNTRSRLTLILGNKKILELSVWDSQDWVTRRVTSDALRDTLSRIIHGIYH